MTKAYANAIARPNRRVLDGIIAATSAVSAGEQDLHSFSERYYQDIELGDAWARLVRDRLVPEIDVALLVKTLESAAHDVEEMGCTCTADQRNQQHSRARTSCVGYARAREIRKVAGRARKKLEALRRTK